MISQIFLSSIIIFVIYKTVISYKKEKLSKVFIALWLILWLTALGFVLQPGLLTETANKVGIGRGVDLAIYLSTAVLFYTTYKILVKLEKINKDITTLIREISLMKAQEKRKR